MKIQFMGAAQTVTGSRTLLTVDGKRILIDAGLFQGPKDKRLLNWTTPFKASTLDAILLTHAHIDHSGLLPRLVREGYNKPVYCSAATKELCRFMLMDSAKLQEEDAQYANDSGYSNHKPAEPLYTVKDAEKAIKLLEVIEDHQWMSLGRQIQVRTMRTGHILGSRALQLAFPTSEGQKTILFSGDMGNGRSRLIRPPQNILESDYLVLESTYGDRLLPRETPLNEFAELINKVIRRNGVVVIPAFAVGRTQEVLHDIWELQKQNKIPTDLPVYVDSPMAREATRAHLKFPQELLPTIDQGQVTGPLNTEMFRCTESTEESRALQSINQPHILISASGMVTGGRIMHHLKNRITDTRNAVVFVGYQATGTKGRVILEGAQELRIHHEAYPIRAEISRLENYSAHADWQDMLIWLDDHKKVPKKIFLNHGELSAQEHFRSKLQEKFPNTEILIPEQGEEFHVG